VKNLALSDYSVRPRQHVRWNRQANFLGRLQIDDERELLRLFHREIGGIGAFGTYVLLWQHSQAERLA
jgi:hypothetical protein